jgi:hypothetical protein
MTGIEIEQRFFPATIANTHTCRNKRRSSKLTIVISKSESVMSACVQKMLPELKRISRMKEKDRKKFICDLWQKFYSWHLRVFENLSYRQFTSETASVEIAVSSQTLVERTCFEKNHIKQSKKDIAER